MSHFVWIDEILRPIYEYEIGHISNLQTALRENNEFLINVSRFGDPSKAFHIAFPILIGLHYATGIGFLGSIILCEWLNQVLKWLVHGHRPYWWVQISPKSPNLQQTPITCETGPGNPSGHVMMTIVIGLTLVNFITSQSSGTLRLILKRILWNGLCFVICIMMASRIYILAHFPHQCFLALVFGYLSYTIAFQRTQKWHSSFSRGRKALIAFGVLFSALMVFMNVEAFLGFNPNWSLQLAEQFCRKKEWIYVETMPLYTMVRYSGSAFGLALSSPRGRHQRSVQKIFFAILINVFIGFASHYIHSRNADFINNEDMLTFYTFEYFLNAFTVFLLLKLS